jgi:acylphosphatase
MEQICKHIIFTGRVQGVGFRFTALDMARRYRINGFVRNLFNGTVEMVAQGNPEAVSGCIRDINESFSGYISDTRIEEIPTNPRYKDFKITF